jgi:hypothetical protein
VLPNTALFEKLKGMVAEVHNIGSSSEPGLIVDAMKAGAKIGYAI